MAGKRTAFKIVATIGIGIIVVGLSAWLYITTSTTPEIPNDQAENISVSPSITPTPESEKLSLTPVTVSGAFTVDIPNGWNARIATRSEFTAIQVGTPGTIDSLTYNKNIPAVIDTNGIPSWDGLTEHFYIRLIRHHSQAFNPALHQNVTTESFSFDDGTIGAKYSVTKDASEAAKWGGLLKDTEWYGRVFVYKNKAITVEAHLAYYPSTKIEPVLFENIAKSTRPSAGE